VRLGPLLAAAALVLPLTALCPGADAAPAAPASRILLDNERVLVKALTIQPGQSTGPHAHPLPELLVFVKGGVLKSAAGRATLWRDGRVVWLDASDIADPECTNVSDAPIELREIILKPVPAGAGSRTDYGYLNYPNIPLEDVFENDAVIVQRFTMVPGQWEGIHAHHPNTLYVYIKGGRYVSRTVNPPTREEGDTPDGYVGWMPAIEIKAGHESGNIGSTPSDVVWIALKH